jgi:outer membrane protein insertion porin family
MANLRLLRLPLAARRGVLSATCGWDGSCTVVPWLLVLASTLAGISAAAGQEASPWSHPGATAAANPAAAAAANLAGPTPNASLAAASPADSVVDVQVRGNKSLPLSKILPSIRTRPGRPFSLELIEEDVRRLDRTRLFINVRTYFQQVPGGRIVIFDLLERPLLTDVLFVGCSEVRKKVLQKESDLKTGDPVDPFAIEEARRKLEEFYHKRGFTAARITLLEGDKTEDRRAVFLINEGTKQKVWNTAFVGNTVASDDRLRTQISTGRPFLYLFGGEFDRKKLDEDVEKLTAYYRGLGYFRARIGREVAFNEKENWVTITFVIDEGPPYKLRNVAVIGNTKFTNEKLLTDLKLKTGDYFNQSKMEADLGKMRDTYGGIGYVFADVKADPRFLEEPALLDLVYNIKEGDPYRVGKINVHVKGEYPHTQITTILNRLSFKPGDIVDIREIRASERRIRASQLFEANPATGNAPKIAFSPPDQEGQNPEDDDKTEVADKRKPGRKSGPGAGPGTGRGRGMGGSMGSGSDGGEGGATFRGQSPDTAPPARELDVTLECGRYIGPKEEGSEVRGQGSEVRGQGSEVRGQGSEVRGQGSEVKGQGRGTRDEGRGTGDEGRGMGTSVPIAGFPQDQTAATNELVRAATELTNAIAQAKKQRSREGLILTQYTSNTTQSDPTTTPGHVPDQKNGVNADFGPLLRPGAQAASSVDPTVAQAGNQSPAAATQAAPVQPAPAYGQQMWPRQGGGYERPVDSPQGPYSPGPIFSESSPFRGGPPDGGDFIRPLPFNIGAEETMTGRLMFGVGINSDAGLVGSVVLDEQNFDWTRFPNSWEDVRNGIAWRGAGQRFRLEAAPGTQLSRYVVNFQEPYLFNTPVQLGLSGFYYTRIYSEYYEQRLGGRVGLGYQFSPDLSGTVAYRGAKINLTNPIDPFLPTDQMENGHNVLLGELCNRDLALHGFQVSLAHNTRDSDFLPTQGHLIEASFEEVLGTFQYPHAELDIRRYFGLYERPDGSGRHVLSLAARAGYTGDDTPLYERYYAGGFSTIRGFQFRGASPQSYDPLTGVTGTIGGNFELLGSAEYMFPITADDMLRAVVFCDTGTVEPTISNWSNKFRVAPGFGLRICVPAMGPAPIALDFAFPISWQPGDKSEMFSFFMGFNR